MNELQPRTSITIWDCNTITPHDHAERGCAGTTYVSVERLIRAEVLAPDDLDAEFDCDECGRSVFCGQRWVQLIDPDEELCLDCAIGAGWTVAT